MSTKEIEQPAASTPIVEEAAQPQKFNDKIRKELLKIKVDVEKVKELLGKGLSLWDATEAIYGRTFEHSNRKTWIFYQKVNNIRHNLSLPNAPMKFSPLTTIAVTSYLQTHTEEELRSILVR